MFFLKRKLQQFCSSQKTAARRISSLVGTIVSMGIAIGQVAKMWTRSLYALVNKAPSWDPPIILSDKTSTEIDFWSFCFETFNGNHIWPTSLIVNFMSYSDSSDFVWGRYIVQIADHIAKGSFTEVYSSTWREFKGIFYVLSSYLKQLQEMVVKRRTDNQNVIRALSNGSKTELIQEQLVVDTYLSCASNLTFSYFQHGSQEVIISGPTWYQDKNPPDINPRTKTPGQKPPLPKTPRTKTPQRKLMNTKYILHK